MDEQGGELFARVGRLVERLERDKLIELDPESSRSAFVEGLMELLAAEQGPLMGRALSEWLLEQDAVAEVFADDAALEKVVRAELSS